jgi:hypothetical protein
MICSSSDLTLGTERTRELEQRAIDQEAEMKRNTAAAAASKAAVSCNCHFSNCCVSNCTRYSCYFSNLYTLHRCSVLYKSL